MGLIGNYRQDLRSPGFFSGTYNYRSVWNTAGASRAMFTVYDKWNSVPAGGIGWVIAERGGGLASFAYMGEIAISAAALDSGINLDASISCAMSTLNADVGAVANCESSLSASLTTTQAALGIVTALSCTIYTLGTVTADLGAQIGLSTNISGSCSIVTNVTALCHLEADISSQTELSPQNLAASLWNSVAGDYNASGTMGEKLNDAGSASNPWTEVIEGPLTASDILKLLLSVQTGQTVITDLGGGNATVKFKSVSGSVDRVLTTVAGSERTSVTLNPT